jgi:hypothetical protein
LAAIAAAVGSVMHDVVGQVSQVRTDAEHFIPSGHIGHEGTVRGHAIQSARPLRLLGTGTGELLGED